MRDIFVVDWPVDIADPAPVATPLGLNINP